MNAKLFNIVLVIGMFCLIVDAIVIILGYSGSPLHYTMSIFGMLLIGAGALGKRRTEG